MNALGFVSIFCVHNELWSAIKELGREREMNKWHIRDGHWVSMGGGDVEPSPGSGGEVDKL